VSIKTVSRVVTGEANVSPERSARVTAAIERLGYVPDPFASSLRRSDRRTGTVAVLVEDLANPFAASLHRAVVDVMRDHGIVTLSASTDDQPAIERQAVAAFLSRRVDGLIVMASPSAARWLDSVVGGAAPIVLVDRPVRGVVADVVRSDHRGGARHATEHLLLQGHRRVAFLGGRRSSFSARERLAGFRAAITASGVATAVVELGLAGSDAAEAAVRRLASGRAAPTAFFTAQNLLTLGAVRALRGIGHQHEIGLLGFDDIPAGDLLDPGISVLAQDPARIGAIAANRVLARLDGDNSPADLTLVDVSLIARGSGEIAPSRKGRP